MTAAASEGWRSFWRGRRVFITGHTGFKGAWLTLWLHRLGAEVTGLSLPPGEHDLFTLARVDALCRSHHGDVRDLDVVRRHVAEARPEIIFHLAAQALVRPGYEHPVQTHATNIMGTVHVLEAIRALADARVAVVVTTDKVYRESPAGLPHREGDMLGGHDPYSASKAASEIVVESYRKAFLAEQGVAVATARAGNVIGGGDWARDRLLPDAVRAWRAGARLQVRAPDSVRPWQHVLEPLAGYLQLARSLWREPGLADAYNFGPGGDGGPATVAQLVELARAAHGSGEVEYLASPQGPHETRMLDLDVSRVRDRLGVRPRWSLHEHVERTVNWYRRQHDGADAQALCLDDIARYEASL